MLTVAALFTLLASTGCPTATVTFANTTGPVVLGDRVAIGSGPSADRYRVTESISVKTGESRTQTSDYSYHEWANSSVLDMEAVQKLQGNPHRAVRNLKIELKARTISSFHNSAWGQVDAEVVELAPPAPLPVPTIEPPPVEKGSRSSEPKTPSRVKEMAP
jgi:hypothetical protein